MTDNKFKEGDLVCLSSKSNPHLNGVVTIIDMYHTADTEINHVSMSDQSIYTGWLYSVTGIEAWVIEPSLSKAG